MMRERNYSITSEEVANTDGESEQLPHDSTLYQCKDHKSTEHDEIYKTHDPSLKRVTSSGSDSWDAIIPEIRINEAAEKGDNNSSPVNEK